MGLDGNTSKMLKGGLQTVFSTVINLFTRLKWTDMLDGVIALYCRCRYDVDCFVMITSFCPARICVARKWWKQGSRVRGCVGHTVLSSRCPPLLPWLCMVFSENKIGFKTREHVSSA